MTAGAGGTPGFAQSWPTWAQWLIDKPLQIAVIVICAVAVVALGRLAVRKATARLTAPASSKMGAIAGALESPYAAERLAARARTAQSVLDSVIKFAVWLIAGALVLERCGVNVAVLVTSIGVVGVGVGLGAQTLIKDVIAGLFMLVEDQYGIGDQIDINDSTGVVEKVSLRVTTVRDAAGEVWYVPNGSVTKIGNRSQRRPGEDGEGA
jgi:small conductance mechanosensitive channel